MEQQADDESSAEPPHEAPAREQRGQRFERWMRVRSSADFAAAYRRGRRARGEHFTVVAAPNQLGYTRLGLSIGKRAWRRAVPRNRLRRAVREAFRTVYRELPSGLDLIVVGSTPQARPTLAEVQRDLVRLTLAALASRRRGRRTRPPGSNEGGP